MEYEFTDMDMLVIDFDLYSNLGQRFSFAYINNSDRSRFSLLIQKSKCSLGSATPSEMKLGDEFILVLVCS